jgi:(p)ppGpp synthase/HD superfamily hydrolase
MSMGEQAFIPSFLDELPLARDAVVYASARHAGQRRQVDEAPFVLHPLEVAALLHNSRHAEPVVAAGALHDTVEDTPAEPSEIRRRFGDEVAALVAAVTEDPTIDDYAERKAQLRRQVAGYGPDAAAVYAADKVAKVRELRGRAGCDRDLLAGEEGSRKLAHYRESLAMLEHVAPEEPLVRQLRFELEALAALPPAGARLPR